MQTTPLDASILHISSSDSPVLRTMNNNQSNSHFILLFSLKRKSRTCGRDECTSHCAASPDFDFLFRFENPSQNQRPTSLPLSLTRPPLPFIDTKPLEKNDTERERERERETTNCILVFPLTLDSVCPLFFRSPAKPGLAMSAFSGKKKERKKEGMKISSRKGWLYVQWEFILKSLV